MEKSVGNVDIEELKKARQELDSERGIESDPNMYDNYNPNRNKEESSEEEQSDDISLENSNSSFGLDGMLDDYLEKEGEPADATFSSSHEDDSAKDKESVDSAENIDSVESKQQLQENAESEEKDYNVYDNFSQFEVKDNVNASENSKNAEESQTENKSQAEEVSEGLDDLLSQSLNTDELDNLLSSLNETLGNLSDGSNEETVESKQENALEQTSLEQGDESKNETQESSADSDDWTSEAVQETQEQNLQDGQEKPKEINEEVNDLLKLFGKDTGVMDLNPEATQNEQTGSEKQTEKDKVDDIEIIDDYKKLKQLDTLLDEELQSVPKKEEEPVKYAEIEQYEFVDIISTDEFKQTDNLSYVLGVDENKHVHYGNLRDFYSMVIFAKNNKSALDSVHSILVSLILKNETSDINFVICDSKADSKLDVYNKSSYMYFNRLAKTNKEILDTLIELSKELDERYEILAGLGVKSIEQYKNIIKDDKTKPLPYILVVFNNYSKSMQLADADKINTIIYQILKYGKIVGIYLIIIGNMPIKSDDINYNLPTRLSYKMTDEEESLSMLGDDGASKLEFDDEFLFFSVDSQNVVHLKSPTVSNQELEALIKNIEL